MSGVTANLYTVATFYKHPRADKKRNPKGLTFRVVARRCPGGSPFLRAGNGWDRHRVEDGRYVASVHSVHAAMTWWAVVWFLKLGTKLGSKPCESVASGESDTRGEDGAGRVEKTQAQIASRTGHPVAKPTNSPS
jgi:hypothetical protein